MFRAPKEVEEYEVPVEQFQDNEGELTLDIYGSTEPDVNRCIQLLDKQFEKTLQKVDWKTKRTYETDRENIAKLTSNQVFDLSKNSDYVCVSCGTLLIIEWDQSHKHIQSYVFYILCAEFIKACQYMIICS